MILFEETGSNKTKNKEKQMKTIQIIALSTFASATLLAAGGDIVVAPEANKTQEVDYGTFNVDFKMVHMFSGLDNGWDRNTGSAFYVNPKYTTPVWNGFSAKVALGILGNTGLRDIQNGKLGGGLYMGDVGPGVDPLLSTETWTGLDEAYLRYQNEYVDIKGGRFDLSTPMTNIKYNLQKNLYEGATIESKKLIPGTKVMVGYLSKMMYGSRAANDYSFAGEATFVNNPTYKNMMTGASYHVMTGRGDYFNFGELAGANDAGMLFAGAVNKSLIPNTKLQVWDYYVDGVLNQIYADAATSYKMQNGVTLKAGAQILSQQLDNNVVQTGDSPLIWGAMASAGYMGFTAGIAYNSSNSDQVVNVWGADPLYTSTILARNAFRPDVDAFKVSAKYVVPKIDQIPGKIILAAAYANYGQSSLVKSQGDAISRNYILTYKPTKKLFFKLWNTTQTSEFNGYLGKEVKVNEVRGIIGYKF